MTTHQSLAQWRGNFCQLIAMFALTAVVTSKAQTVDSLNPSPDGPVDALCIQPDGRILIGGTFTTLFGDTCPCLGRINPDGTRDLSFDAGDFEDFDSPSQTTVRSLALQPDGKILVGGTFKTIRGPAQYYLGRLNSNGSLDSTFKPEVDTGEGHGDPLGIYAIAVDPDGKILVGGKYILSIGGQPRNCLGRLNSDGSLDTTFNPAAGVEEWGTVLTLLIQKDGKILVGGEFFHLNGHQCANLGRLKPNGDYDSSFDANVNNANCGVRALAIQSDGKILVGGYFEYLKDPCFCLGRINGDGSLDTTFDAKLNPDYSSTYVNSIVVQADGKILVAGRLGIKGHIEYRSLARFHTDGSLDTNFNIRASTVHSLALQADGKLLVGGEFTQLGDQDRGYFGRLTLTEPATESISLEAAKITWMRSGTSPEVSSTSFDLWNPTSGWSNLGSGTRIPGGWVLTGLSLPANATIRARGSVNGGLNNSSSWFVETFEGPVVIISQPASASVEPGENAVLKVSAVGSSPTYQWYKNGSVLTGATASSLSLTNLKATDAGSSYRVVVSNRFGHVTSGVAVLTVNVINRDNGFRAQANGRVSTLAMQANQNVLLGGEFTLLDGLTCNRLARLTPGGTLDASFHAEANDTVHCLALQINGSILVGGEFTKLDEQTRNYLGRLDANGNLDPGFNPQPNGGIYSVAVQPDGLIVVGGEFTQLGGKMRSGIARLNVDGIVDNIFHPNVAAGGSPVSEEPVIEALALQTDGKIVLGGSFISLDGQAHSHVGRLNTNGVADNSFKAQANSRVTALAVQADGKILVGGEFTTLNGQSRSHLGRLNADGTLDTQFHAEANARINAISLQADGSILLGGEFHAVNGQPRLHLARLDPDGTLDYNYNPTADEDVYALTLQADGQILVGGEFTRLQSRTQLGVGRLENNVPATEQATIYNSKITWLRGGSSPEIGRSTFEVFMAGTFWRSLGNGERISGGWQLTNITLSPNARVRARGFVSGTDESAGWFVQSIPALIYSLTCNVSPPWTGSIHRAPVSQDGNYAANTVVWLTAEPPPLYAFAYWSGSVSGTINPTNIEMNTNKVLTAHFVAKNEPGTLQFKGNTYPAVETNASVTVTVTRTGGSNGVVSITYSTSDNTALAGQDYTATSGTLVWTDRDTSAKTFQIPLLNNLNLPEFGETFNVLLSNPTGGARVGGYSTAQVKLAAHDLPVYTLTWNVNPPGSGWISLVPGLPAGKYTVNTEVLLYAEPTAGFVFSSWSGDVAGTISPTNAVMDADKAITANFIIANQPGTLQFTHENYHVNEGAGTVTIAVTRVGGNYGAVSVYYSTSSGTATAPLDYTEKSGMLFWSNGDNTEKSFQIIILDDTLAESTETFQVMLSGQTGGANIGPPTTVSIEDNDVETTELKLLYAASRETLTLSWDTTVTGFKLDATPSLSPPVLWNPVPGVVSNRVTVPLPGGSRFFRLCQ